VIEEEVELRETFGTGLPSATPRGLTRGYDGPTTDLT
jgi:hypothetical protein